METLNFDMLDTSKRLTNLDIPARSVRPESVESTKVELPGVVEDPTMKIMRDLMDLGFLSKQWDPSRLTAIQEAGIAQQDKALSAMMGQANVENEILARQSVQDPAEVKLAMLNTPESQTLWGADVLTSLGLGVGDQGFGPASTSYSDYQNQKGKNYYIAKMGRDAGDHSRTDSLRSESFARLDAWKKQLAEKETERKFLQLQQQMILHGGSDAGGYSSQGSSSQSRPSSSLVTMDPFHSVYSEER